MTTDLAIKTPIATGDRGLQLDSLDSMWRFANYVTTSGFAPKGMERPESVLVAMQMGFEIGLSPMQAIQNIAVINNRPSLWGDAVKALILSSGQCEDFREWFEGEGDKTVAHCEIKRRGYSPTVRSFSWADAKLAELASKPGPWKQYPKRMLQMRARSWACRDAFPDALRGLLVREEVEDMAPIDVTPKKREVASIDVNQIIAGPPPDEPHPDDAPKPTRRAKAKADPEPTPAPVIEAEPDPVPSVAQPAQPDEARAKELRKKIMAAAGQMRDLEAFDIVVCDIANELNIDVNVDRWGEEDLEVLLKRIAK